LKITKIRLHYRLKAPADKRAAIDRVLAVYADNCPAYASVKGCIECSWSVEVEEV
jgi:uncharacterized OsmC-like protein